MLLSELIEEAQDLIAEEGDMKCLVEIIGKDDVAELVEVGELNVENREGYGKSVSIIC